MGMGGVIVLIVMLFVFGGLGRRMGWRSRHHEGSDQETRERVADLYAELERLRDLPERMMELEERLEFAERLLAQERAREFPRQGDR